MTVKILVINGPNLNMLGKREPDTYGKETLADIEQAIQVKAASLNVTVSCFQSNAESAIIDKIHQMFASIDAIVINPAAYTHTSVAIRDALLCINVPIFEVHLSNIHKREPFRHHSYISDISEGVICGFGSQGYLFALEAAANLVKRKNVAEH